MELTGTSTNCPIQSGQVSSVFKFTRDELPNTVCFLQGPSCSLRGNFAFIMTCPSQGQRQPVHGQQRAG